MVGLTSVQSSLGVSRYVASLNNTQISVHSQADQVKKSVEAEKSFKLPR